MSEAAVKPNRAVRWALPVLMLIAVGSLVAAIFLPVPWRKQPGQGEVRDQPDRRSWV